MKQFVDDLKSSLVVVKALSVYDYQNQHFLFEDKDLPDTKFMVSMAENHCFDDTDFLYLESETHHMFLRIDRENRRLAILQLDQSSNFNKVILEHKCAELLSKIA